MWNVWLGLGFITGAGGATKKAAVQEGQRPRRRNLLAEQVQREDGEMFSLVHELTVTI